MIIKDEYFKLIFTGIVLDRISNKIYTQSFDSEKEAINYCMNFGDKKNYDYEWQVIFGFPMPASGSRSNKGS